ncbi:hypothetical protein ZHAS_00014252 [Anopheles sinensis]|uniref:ADP-ribosylation factor-related protein 1 n=1 Tax=Anopheles sinensis TaxID=74873 RepID=A0A084W7Q7_ANOSI|nr:hypothetical protein ZHAS_00014252 [Anopheles sinensis]
MYTLLSGFYKYLTQKDEYCILILGLDNAGKTTYLEAAKTKLTKNYRGMNPSKITTTVGLNIGQIDIAGIRLSFWDLGGQQELQSLWDKYYSESHAVIYVVDSNDRTRMNESKDVFDRMISNEYLSGIPLLVLANKQDLPDCMGVREIKPVFQEAGHLIGRRDCLVMPVSALTGTPERKLKSVVNVIDSGTGTRRERSAVMDYTNYTNVYSPNRDACLVLNKTKILINLYEGIPETLLLNVIAWFFLILLFNLLRQQAWDYGRLALVNIQGENKRWTQLFYAHRNAGGSGSSETSDAFNSISIDRGCFSWILATFRLTKEQILTHSGPDAVHYLSFQRHLMAVMGIMTVVSIAIILPINFSGTLSGDKNSFGHTTISNLDPDSPSMWAHVFFAIAYVPMVVLIMRRASGRNAFKTAPTRTIMATNISQGDCSKTVIRTYLHQLFPEVEIQDIQMAYNISRLIKAAEEYERTVEARIFCEAQRKPNAIEARPLFFSCNKVDALEYYKEKEVQLGGEVARLRASALNEPLGIAFVTLRSVQDAQHVMLHFKPGTYREWNLSFAPAPSDIFWENLNIDTAQWYCKWATVNFALFLFLFFLTTPVIIVNQLDTLSLTKNTTSQISKISPLISEFLPTLLLWSLSALMPVIVAYSDTWLSHWTRSRQNYLIMTKTFGYLLFMILILPSLGLTSAQALLQWTIESNDTYRWECIFLPDKGAFFVNYIITAAFIGTALELIRFPDLICYIWKLATAKSRAETPYIRKSILITFPFGIHYAWMVMVFTTSMVYSLACPLIMPFAMVYISLKHFVDKHNLFFAFAPSNMISQGSGGKIHSTAVTMTKFSVVLLLVIMAALAVVRTGQVELRAVVLILALCATLVMFASMSPIKRCTTKPLRIVETGDEAPIYVADVLINRRMVSDSPSHLSYGSDTTMNIALNDAGVSVTA